LGIDLQKYFLIFLSELQQIFRFFDCRNRSFAPQKCIAFMEDLCYNRKELQTGHIASPVIRFAEGALAI
jgi:hypothetical protein